MKKVDEMADITEKNNKESEDNKKDNRMLRITAGGACLALVGLALFTYSLEQRIARVEANTSQIEDKLAKRVDDNRKIYVYNMEETLLAAGIPASSQQFESDIASLEREVADAQEKIKTLKEAQVKEEFSDMYLRSLKMRRDELINKYSESMQATLDKINKALEDVARENSVHTIFMSNSIAVNTEYVVDITAQVVEKMQQQ